MTAESPNRYERQKAQTRARILVASTELFNRYGYDGVTVEQIAEAAGICSGPSTTTSTTRRRWRWLGFTSGWTISVLPWLASPRASRRRRYSPGRWRRHRSRVMPAERHCALSRAGRSSRLRPPCCWRRRILRWPVSLPTTGRGVQPPVAPFRGPTRLPPKGRSSRSCGQLAGGVVVRGGARLAVPWRGERTADGRQRSGRHGLQGTRRGWRNCGSRRRSARSGRTGKGTQ